MTTLACGCRTRTRWCVRQPVRSLCEGNACAPRSGCPRRQKAVPTSAVRFYDPTTGQFLTRDPITPLTRSPYGYVYGNPLNNTDPSGLWSVDLPGDWCYGTDCVDNVVSHQDAANFAGGVLNGVTLGNGPGILNLVGAGNGVTSAGQVDWTSPYAVSGNVLGVAAVAPLAAEEGAAFSAYSRAATAGTVLNACFAPSATLGGCMARAGLGLVLQGGSDFVTKQAADAAQGNLFTLFIGQPFGFAVDRGIIDPVEACLR